MNGPQHYAEGERILAEVDHDLTTAYYMDQSRAMIALATAHFTAALVAATMDSSPVPGASAKVTEWSAVLS